MTDTRPETVLESLTIGSSIMDYQLAVRQVNEANGWFDLDRPFAADVALLHSEISEAYEGYRNDDHVNMHEEIADVFIRILDTCERYNIQLEEEVIAKLNKNATRGYRHGGKVE